MWTKNIFDGCKHAVNHIMISPDGKRFIFIHRFYKGNRRHDRLMLSDFNDLKVLADDDMVSHCHWIDKTNIIGYFRHNGKNAFYTCNTDTCEIKEIAEMNSMAYGDGHPSCHSNWVVFDTYPDKGCMQHLFLFNLNTRRILPLLEVYHSPRFTGETRCDLHPRFSNDGRSISFDSVFQGRRKQCLIDVSKITQ